ncbi:MAG: hypothetical protein DRG11_01605 [Epsilonproteobacteria bacterium]|nr:MAG: hypothetical protein DRG11_01605 [Campylobacterota bacterium]
MIMLDIDLVLLFGSALVFLIVLVVLNKMLFLPLMIHIDNRELNIKKKQNKNENIELELNSILNQSNNLLIQAKQKSKDITDKATDEANKQAEKLYQNALTLQNNKIEEFQASYDTKKSQLEKSLQGIELEICDKINDKIKSA